MLPGTKVYGLDKQGICCIHQRDIMCRAAFGTCHNLCKCVCVVRVITAVREVSRINGCVLYLFAIAMSRLMSDKRFLISIGLIPARRA